MAAFQSQNKFVATVDDFNLYSIAFLTYDSADTAADVVKNGQLEIEGQMFNVEMAKPKRTDGGGRGGGRGGFRGGRGGGGRGGGGFGGGRGGGFRGGRGGRGRIINHCHYNTNT